MPRSTVTELKLQAERVVNELECLQRRIEEELGEEYASTADFIIEIQERLLED